MHCDLVASFSGPMVHQLVYVPTKVHGRYQLHSTMKEIDRFFDFCTEKLALLMGKCACALFVLECRKP